MAGYKNDYTSAILGGGGAAMGFSTPRPEALAPRAASAAGIAAKGVSDAAKTVRSAFGAMPMVTRSLRSPVGSSSPEGTVSPSAMDGIRPRPVAVNAGPRSVASPMAGDAPAPPAPPAAMPSVAEAMSPVSQPGPSGMVSGSWYNPAFAAISPQSSTRRVTQPAPAPRQAPSVSRGPSQQSVASLINARVSDGRAAFAPAMGGMILDTQTGRPVEFDMADSMGVQRANEMADSAASRSRWNEGFGVGDQMNARRQAEVDDVMNNWSRFYDGNQGSSATQIGVRPQGDMAARNAAFRQELADSAARNDAAIAQRRRFERGMPMNADEAMLFAMQRGAAIDPARAMEAFGSGTFNLGRNDTAMYATDAMAQSSRDSALLQAMQFGNEAQAAERRLAMDEQRLQEQIAQQRRENVIALNSLTPERAEMDAFTAAKQRGASDQQARIEASRARSLAIITMNNLASSPEFEGTGVRTYGMDTPQFVNQLAGQGAPITSPSLGMGAGSALGQRDLGVPGFGPEGRTGALDMQGVMDFYNSTKAKYGGELTPEAFQNELRNAGIVVTPEVQRDIMKNASRTAQQGLIPWYLENASPLALGSVLARETGVGSMIPGRRNADARATPFAEASSMLSGRPVQPYDRSMSQYFGF